MFGRRRIQALEAQVAELRAVTEVPWSVGGPLQTAVSQERALGLGPVYAANRFLADTISTLPFHGFRDVGDTRRRMSVDPPLIRWLREAGTLVPWLYETVTSLGLRGNAVGVVTSRDGLGFPTSIAWVSMDHIHVDDADYPAARWWYKGRPVARSELVHIPWFKLPGRTLGLSPIEAYALTIDTGIQSQEYGNSWFAAGGVPPGTFKNSAKQVDQGEADAIKARLVAAIRRRQPIVYGADWDYNAITIPPEQAQFIETMKVTANQVAAIYGVDPEEVGGEPANSLTYNNEEHRQTKRMANLRPWLVRIESALSAGLPQRQYLRFNADATIRADLKSRFEVYKTQRDIGFASIDEQRALEQLAPLPGGQGTSYAPLTGAAPALQSTNGNGQRHHEWALPN